MSEKAQKIRKKRMRYIKKLRSKAEIAFDFVLDELDERTKNKDFLPVKITLTHNGVPTTNNGKMCNTAKIGTEHHWTFLKILEKMFNDEPGYTAEIEERGLYTLYISIDV